MQQTFPSSQEVGPSMTMAFSLNIDSVDAAEAVRAVKVAARVEDDFVRCKAPQKALGLRPPPSGGAVISDSPPTDAGASAPGRPADGTVDEQWGV